MNAREINPQPGRQGLRPVCCAMICGLACLGLTPPVQARDATHKKGTRQAAAHALHRHTRAPSQAHRGAHHGRKVGVRRARHAARHAGTSTRGLQSPAGGLAPTRLTSGILSGPLDGPLSPLTIAFGHVDIQPAARVDHVALPASSDVDFIGMVEAERHDLKVAVLRVGHRVVYGRAGDLLAGRYRLLRFCEEAAQVFDVDTAATRTLAMGTP